MEIMTKDNEFDIRVFESYEDYLEVKKACDDIITGLTREKGRL